MSKTYLKHCQSYHDDSHCNYCGTPNIVTTSSKLLANVNELLKETDKAVKCSCGCICMKCQVFLDCCCGRKHTDHGKVICGPFQSKSPQNDTINPLKRTVQERLQKMQLKDLSDKIQELIDEANKTRTQRIAP